MGQVSEGCLPPVLEVRGICNPGRSGPMTHNPILNFTICGTEAFFVRTCMNPIVERPLVNMTYVAGDLCRRKFIVAVVCGPR